MPNGLATYKVNLTANQTRNVNARGVFIYMKETSFAVQIELRQNELGDKAGLSFKNTVRKGEKWYSATEFDHVTITNLENQTIDIELVIGYGDYARELPERVDAADFNVTTLGTMAAVNTPQQLIAERVRRKRVTVQARIANGASVVRVAESAAQLVAGAYIELTAGAGYAFESKSALWMESDTIGDLVTAVEEVYNA